MAQQDRPAIRWTWVAAAATLAVGASVALSELNRLVGDMLDTDGASWTFSYVFGPGRSFHPGQGEQAWRAWEHLPAAQAHTVSALLLAHLVCDGLFIAAYTAVGVLLLRGRAPRTLLALAVVVVADVVEDLLALGCCGYLATGHQAPTALLWLVGVATTAKWLAVLAFAVSLLRFVTRTPRPWVAVGRVLHALYLQRYSVVAVTPIVVGTLGPGNETLDQLPDVQRRWFDSWGGSTQFVASAATLTLLAAAVFVLGRLRAGHLLSERSGLARSESTHSTQPNQPTQSTQSTATAARTPTGWLWVAPPVAVLALALLATALRADVYWTPLVIIAGVSVLVVGGSRAVDWLNARWGRGTDHHRPAPRGNVELAHLARSVGDALAVGVLAVGGLGLVRALTAEVVLGRWWVSIVVVAGATGAVLLWPVAAWAQRLGLPSVLVPDERTSPRVPPAVAVALAAAGVLLLLAQALLPVPSGHYIGVLASVSLALTGLVLIGAVIVVTSQSRRPQSVFVALGMHTTPVISLLLLASFVIWGMSGDEGVHGLQGLGGTPGSAATARPTLALAYASWLAQSGPCDHLTSVATDHGTRPVAVRPMVLVAADGGGIRAAYWTVSAFSNLSRSASACGPHATLLSSGVSGGSVGLALTDTEGPVNATKGVDALAAPVALGAAGVGFLVRDNIAAITGVHLPAYDLGGHQSVLTGSTWQDRATLMQGVWTAQARKALPADAAGGPHDLGGPFLSTDLTATARSATGALLLNSTSTGTQCRTVLSQVALSPTPAPRTSVTGADQDPQCRNGSGAEPATFDLLSDYAAGPGANDSGCLHDLSMVTAALASARFPFITPSGVVGPCRGLSTQQLIDGGYAESTGLGTVDDLGPAWLSLVQNSNTAALTALDAPTAAAQAPVFVVPVVELLQNHFGTDVRPSTSAQTSELQVPLRGRGAKSVQVGVTTLLQRAADLTSATSVCPGTAPGTASTSCTALREAVAQQLPYRVVVVAPDTRPAVTAPLGWVLSAASRDNLDSSMAGQLSLPCATRRTAYCAAGYGRLADLVSELTP